MELLTLKARPPLPKNSRSTYASLRTFNLPTLIETMKRSHSWSKGDLNAMILLKSPERQIVLTALHGNTEIESFQSSDSITFQIIEGKLTILTRKESVTLDKGQFLELQEKLRYRLTSREETVFLLTIASSEFKPVTN